MAWPIHVFQATGTISTSKGTVEFTVLTHALKDFHAVNYRGTGGERAAGFEWHPRQGDSPWGETVCKGSYIGNPPLSSGVTPQSQVAFTQQPLRSGASYATAHASRVEADGTTTLFASTAQPQTDVNSIGTAGQSAAAYVAISNVEVRQTSRKKNRIKHCWIISSAFPTSTPPLAATLNKHPYQAPPNAPCDMPYVVPVLVGR